MASTPGIIKCSPCSHTQAHNADAGIVKTQAHRIFEATPQRTAFTRCTAPTPAIAPAVTCVVETGSFKNVADKIEAAAPPSAQNPVRGFSFVSRFPTVWIMRHPPANVHKAIAR